MSSIITTSETTATATAAATPALRVHGGNPNHHLWNNHGTWFLHYTVHPTPFTKERIRRSLGTKDLSLARERRDAYFAHLGARMRATPIAA
ncbi:MAG TPA: hypothetical protein VG838_12480 [Opitutaceae bacterium]|nr:hypothetical protein [Opitutaceae bacterium]